MNMPLTNIWMDLGGAVDPVQPYEDPQRVRVTGPFLSPHRVLTPEQDRAGTEAVGEFDDTGGSFVNVVLDNLRKAGVQNTVKQERLVFDRLEPYSGLYLQAAGDYTPEGGNSQRFAICIGPQYETVGPDLVNQAAKEAVQGLGFNLLIVLGFAFDPPTSFRLDSSILEPLSNIQQLALHRSVAPCSDSYSEKQTE